MRFSPISQKLIVISLFSALAVSGCQTTGPPQAELSTIEDVKVKMHLGEPLTDADKKVLADYYNANR